MKWRVMVSRDGRERCSDFEFGNLRGLSEYLELSGVYYVPGLMAILRHFETTGDLFSVSFDDGRTYCFIEGTVL